LGEPDAGEASATSSSIDDGWLVKPASIDGVGVLTGYWFAPIEETTWRLAMGLLSGIAGTTIWHFLLVPAARYIWVVPEEEHLAQATRIYELERELGRVTAGAGAVVSRLTTHHQNGVQIRDRIRRHAKKPWDKSLKVAAKSWARDVTGCLQSHAPDLLVRFQLDTPKTLQGPQPYASHDVSNWGNYMDRKLDNLQEIIERLSQCGA